MELIDRYLHEVKFWLPKAQKEDIIAELSQDIQARIEEKETELGRQLTKLEAEAILKQLGSPRAGGEPLSAATVLDRAGVVSHIRVRS